MVINWFILLMPVEKSVQVPNGITSPSSPESPAELVQFTQCFHL